MKALLIQNQKSQGCDYSIGCGTAIQVFEAGTKDALYNMALRFAKESCYIEGDHALDSCTFIYVENEVDFMPILKKWDNDEKEEIHLQREAEEKAEYERLQKKYGK